MRAALFALPLSLFRREGFCTEVCLKGHNTCTCDWSDEHCGNLSPEELAKGVYYTEGGRKKQCWILPTKSTMQIMTGITKHMKDAGFAVTQMCNVIDVGDLSLASTVSDSSVLSALRTIADVDQAHYPENLGVTLVCNAPWSFRAAWSVVRVFLSAETQEKFVVLGAGETGKETLGKILGVDRVPAFLGGTCRCDGGCVCLDPVVGETKDVLTPAQVE